MSFEDLYDSCFKDLPVVLLPYEKREDATVCGTTLDHVLTSSQYIIFFSGYGAKAKEMAKLVDDLVKRKNCTEKDGGKDSSPARIRRFFGLKKKKKGSSGRESPDGGVVISVVRVGSWDEQSPEGWFGVAHPDDIRTMSRLLRSLQVETNPSIFVLECSTRRIVTYDGRRLIAEDPIGEHFPWRRPSVDSVLGGSAMELLHCRDGQVEKTQMEKKTVTALLFGAFWCPPCREWVKHLSAIYHTLTSTCRHSIEIIFCSSDRSLQAFNTFLAMMPWKAFPYDPAHTITLTRVFRVNGIPSLILLDHSYQVISRHGRSVLLDDPKGAYFPWKSRALYELTEHSVPRLREEPSLILFTEGSPDDVRFSVSVLSDIAATLLKEREEKGPGGVDENDATSSQSVATPPWADPLQVFYTGEDPICDHIVDRILGLGDAELPLLVIIDSVVGVYAVCEDEDVSSTVIDTFVGQYKTGKLQWKKLPPSDQHKTVGGIPRALIQEMTRGATASITQHT